MQLKSDRYRKARGGHSRLQEIACAKCGAHVCTYQKDGPGILKRLYLDRIHEPEKLVRLQRLSWKDVPSLRCAKCKELLGVPMNYKKENRPAFRLFVGAVCKHVTKSG